MVLRAAQFFYPTVAVAPAVVNANGTGYTFTTAAGNGTNKSGGDYVINTGVATGPLSTLGRNGRFRVVTPEGTFEAGSFWDIVWTTNSDIDSGLFSINTNAISGASAACSVQNNAGSAQQFGINSTGTLDLSNQFTNGASFTGTQQGYLFCPNANDFFMGSDYACIKFNGGSANLQCLGTVGFNNTTPIAKPTITGSRGGNAALASLLTALANYGLITDSTTV